MKSPVFEQLLANVARKRNGEFIAAGESLEVHVYLQRGRIAWATDAANPFAFARHLRSEAKIDEEAFRMVLESCRRDRLPLGETLVAWGLATLDDVRAGLRRQVSLALDTLGRSPADASAVFLERERFGHYDERLTFAIDELAADAVREQPGPTPPVRVDDLLTGIRGASWAYVLDGGRIVESAAASGGPNLEELDALRAVTLGDEADFVALRAPDGAILGASLDTPSRQLWCGLSADATYGAAFAAVNALSHSAARRSRPSDARGARKRWADGAKADTWRASLEQVLQYGADVLAAGLFDVGGALVAGMGAVDLAAEQLVATVVRRRAVFGAASSRATGRGSLESLGFRYRTLVVGEPEVWCFGSESIGEHLTPWVITRRSATQGVGWACLNALARMAQAVSR